MGVDGARELDWAEAGEAVLLRELTRQQQQMVDQFAADLTGPSGDEISDADRGFLDARLATQHRQARAVRHPSRR